MLGLVGAGAQGGVEHLAGLPCGPPAARSSRARLLAATACAGSRARARRYSRLGLRLAPEVEQAAGGVGDRHGVEVVLLLRPLEERRGPTRCGPACRRQKPARLRAGKLWGSCLTIAWSSGSASVAVPLLHGLGGAVEVLGDADHGARVGQAGRRPAPRPRRRGSPGSRAGGAAPRRARSRCARGCRASPPWPRRSSASFPSQLRAGRGCVGARSRALAGIGRRGRRGCSSAP